MKKKILILSGDPNSVNSEIIYKTWKKLNNSIKKKIYLISNYNLLRSQFKKFNYFIKMEKVKSIYDNSNSNNLKILDIKLKFENPFKVKKKEASKFILDSLDLAHNLANNKVVLGFVNCAINKELLMKNKIGVTEYLAKKCNIRNNSEVMLIRNKKLAVCPVTTHVDIKQVSKMISKKKIINKVKTIHFWYQKKFKIKPRIAVLGLNPHNAELRIKSEERNIITPSIKLLKKLKISIDGPLSADSFFIQNYKNYDVVIGMFHDQILPPFKAIFKFDAINITLGLNYLRVSPDHGTAVNLIGKNKANPESLLQCVDLINKFGK